MNIKDEYNLKLLSTGYYEKYTKEMNIQFGLISRIDAIYLMRTIDLIAKDFPNEAMNITEIGLFNGDTGKGIREYCMMKKYSLVLTGIDNEKDKTVSHLSHYFNLIIGNSTEVYNQLEDNSQHLIFIDGLHSFVGVVNDVCCYGQKVKKGGYLILHDAAPHAQGKDFQRVGNEEDKDNYISVLKALEVLGMYGVFAPQIYPTSPHGKWEKTFHEWDSEDACGGMIVFKKLY